MRPQRRRAEMEGNILNVNYSGSPTCSICQHQKVDVDNVSYRDIAWKKQPHLKGECKLSIEVSGWFSVTLEIN